MYSAHNRLLLQSDSLLLPPISWPHRHKSPRLPWPTVTTGAPLDFSTSSREHKWWLTTANGLYSPVFCSGLKSLFVDQRFVARHKRLNLYIINERRRRKNSRQTISSRYTAYVFGRHGSTNSSSGSGQCTTGEYSSSRIFMPF